MSKKLQLQIPTPCHENWDHMSPVEKGRFCGSCQKQVVDFSNMNDREVAMFFKKPSTGSVCGRFMQDQLGRDIEIPRKRIPWVKYFFQFLLPAFLISVKVNAQLRRAATKETQKIECSKLQVDIAFVPDNNIFKASHNVLKREMKVEKLEDMTLGMIAMDAHKIVLTIKGKVVNEKNEPISFASLKIPGTKFTRIANEDGSFEIKWESWSGELQIEAKAPGYTGRIIQITPQHNSALIILMPEQPLVKKDESMY